MYNIVLLLLVSLLIVLNPHYVAGQTPSITVSGYRSTITPPPLTALPAEWLSSRSRTFDGMSYYLGTDVYGTDPDSPHPTKHPNSSYCSSSAYDRYTSWFDQQTPISGTGTDLRINSTSTWYRWPNYALSTVLSEPCCQQCWVNAQKIEVLYWPTPAIEGAPTSFVSDGVTFVSPSPYIAFRGVTGGDWLCGTRSWTDDTGSKTELLLTTTIAYPPGQISSVLWKVGTPSISTTVPYRFEDLATNIHPNCSTDANGLVYSQRLTVIEGTSWYDQWCGPHIAKPTGIDNLHPAFKGCSIANYLEDPPMALTGVASITPVVEQPALPAQTPHDPPAFTSKGIALPTVSQFPGFPIPTPPVVIGQPSHEKPPQNGNSPAGPPESHESIPDTKPADPGNPKPPSGDPNSNPVGPAKPGPPAGNPPNAADPASPADPSTPQITAAPFFPAPDAAQTRPGGIILGSHTLLPGASAVTFSNTPISLDPSGILHVGDATIGLPPITPLPAAQNPLVGLGLGGARAVGTAQALPTFEAGGRTFTVLGPSALIVEGQTVSASATGVVVDGTSIALNAGNSLVVGTKTFGPADITMSAGGVAVAAGAAGTNQTALSFCEMVTKGLGWYGAGVIGTNSTKSGGDHNCGARLKEGDPKVSGDQDKTSGTIRISSLPSIWASGLVATAMGIPLLT